MGIGQPRPGSTVTFALASRGDGYLPYRVGTSLGTGPIQIDTRQLGPSPDGLLNNSVHDLWRSVFVNYRGFLASYGQAAARMRVPNIPVLIGLWLHSAFVTLKPLVPSGIRSISNTFSFRIG